MSEKERDSPYQGLVPYDEEDWPYFCGREKDTRLIIANLFAAPLTLLFGASGVGKSSVLRAGVAHELGSRHNLLVVVFNTWQSEPVGGLKAAVEQSGAKAGLHAINESIVLAQTAPLDEYLATYANRFERRLMIILDQFEEYFLYHPQDDAFAAEFPKAVTRADMPVSFLISIREDCLAKVDRFEGRIPILFDNYLRIEHLDGEAAREAIKKPIEQFNSASPGHVGPRRANEDLVKAVLDQIKAGQGLLSPAGQDVRGTLAARGPKQERVEPSYLQLVMERLWNEEVLVGSGELRLGTLDRLGGATRIIRTYLDQKMSERTPKEQEAATRVFHYLVTPSGSKFAHAVSDLAELAGLPEGELQPVLHELSRARILRPVAPQHPVAPLDQPGMMRYEIFHDVLAPAILEWRSRRVQMQKEAEAKRRYRRRFTQFASVLLIVFIGAVAIRWYWTQRAKQLQALAEFPLGLLRHAQAAIEVNEVELSLLLAIESLRRYPTDDATRFLQSFPLVAQVKHQGGRAIGIRGDGPFLVTTSGSDSKRWKLPAGRLEANWIHKGVAEGRATQVALSPDTMYVVVAIGDPYLQQANTVWIGQTTDDARILSVDVDEPVSKLSLSLSSEGRYVAIGGMVTVQVWEPRAEKRIRTLPRMRPVIEAVSSWLLGNPAPVNLPEDLPAVVLSPDGKHLATATDRVARIYELEAQRQEMLLHTEGAVTAIAFSCDGHCLGTASNLVDPTRAYGPKTVIAIWDVDNGQKIASASIDWPVSIIALSANGLFVAAAGLEDTVRIWKRDTGPELADLNRIPQKGPMKALTLSSDGRLLATLSGDIDSFDKVRVWNTTGENTRLTKPLRPKELIADACRRLTRNFDRDEWRQYFPNELYRKTCPELPAGDEDMSLNVPGQQSQP